MINQKIQLTDDGKNLFPNPNLVGIDMNNVLATNVFPYTATEDCFAYCSPNAGGVAIDGKSAVYGYQVNIGAIVPVKKGQIITQSATYGSTIIVYGLKYI